LNREIKLKAEVVGHNLRERKVVKVIGNVTSAEISYRWLKYSLTIESGTKKYIVGGWGCRLKDIGAHNVTFSFT